MRQYFRGFAIVLTLLPGIAWAQNPQVGWNPLAGAVPLTAGTTSTSATLPGAGSAPPAAIKVCNNGSPAAFVAFGDSTVAAFTPPATAPHLAGSAVLGSSCQLFVPPSAATTIAAITSTGSTSLIIEAGYGSPQASNSATQFNTTSLTVAQQCFGQGCAAPNNTPATYTYTPTTGMLFAYVELQCPGGGAGGNTQGVNFTGTPGHSGSYSAAWFSAAQIGTSQSLVTVAGGLGGTAGNNAGGIALSASSFGTAPGTTGLTCNGGGAGGGSTASTGGTVGSPAAAGVAAGNTGTAVLIGSPSVIVSGQQAFSAASIFAGTQGPPTTGDGPAATGCGAGGMSGKDNNSATRAGGAGGAACVHITELVYQ